MSKIFFSVLFGLVFILSPFSTAANGQEQSFKITSPWFFVKEIPAKFEISSKRNTTVEDTIQAIITTPDTTYTFYLINGSGTISVPIQQKGIVTVEISNYKEEIDVNPIPLWFSIIPPLIAILLALLLKEVYTALFLGIIMGTTAMHFYSGSNMLAALFQGIFTFIDTYLIRAIADVGHASIIVFSLLIGAMVSLITVNGGMKGVVDVLAKRARSPRSGQMITYLLGIAIFFDDYANTMVVGNTMRPVTDRLKISREKLAYLVDATAAPIAALALITTWIGIELSYIQEGLNAINIDESAYSVFIKSLNTRFYPIFTIIFMFMIIWMKRDYGSMYKFEIMAREAKPEEEPQANSNSTTHLEEVTDKARWYNAVIPVLVVVFGTIIALFYTGYSPEVWDNQSITFGTKVMDTIGNANSYTALLWASILGVLCALGLTLTQRLVNLNRSMEALIDGIKTMLPAILILVMAWSLAAITMELHTANYISGLLIKMQVSPYLMPALTFVLAAAIAFSTGTSWGTMAILYPLILPASWLINQQNGLSYDTSINLFYGVISSILAGAVFGDHCSPISDTTILSSLASGCNHINHVKTQMPYALTVAGVSLCIGIIPSAYGVSTWILYPVGTLIMWAIIRKVGKKT